MARSEFPVDDDRAVEGVAVTQVHPFYDTTGRPVTRGEAVTGTYDRPPKSMPSAEDVPEIAPVPPIPILDQRRVPDRRPGRPKLPRDADGNIIR